MTSPYPTDCCLLIFLVPLLEISSVGGLHNFIAPQKAN